MLAKKNSGFKFPKLNLILQKIFCYIKNILKDKGAAEIDGLAAKSARCSSRELGSVPSSCFRKPRIIYNLSSRDGMLSPGF